MPLSLSKTISFLLKIFTYTTLGVLLVAFLPGIPPLNVEYDTLPALKTPWTGTMGPNSLLNTLAKPMNNVVEYGGATTGKKKTMKGPESFAHHGGYIYTGISGGQIIRRELKSSDEEPWHVIFKHPNQPKDDNSQFCSIQHNEVMCGRVLGLEFDSKGRLLVSDAYLGIYRIEDVGNVNSRITTFVTSDVKVDGKRGMTFNSLALSANNPDLLYYTVSSTQFLLSEGMMNTLVKGSGRVMTLNMKQNKSSVLMEGLNFANGIILDPVDESYLLVAETGRKKIWKLNLKDGSKTIYMASVPGAPDNLKLWKKDSQNRYTLLLGVVVPRNPQKFDLLSDILLPSEFLSRLLVRTMALFVYTPKWITENIVDSSALRSLAYWASNFEVVLPFVKKGGLILELDLQSGEVLKSWHSMDGKVPFICEGYVVGGENGRMYLGSPWNNRPYVIDLTV